jgi:ATP/maltotriose-dependent transcriptional regulator MalT
MQGDFPSAKELMAAARSLIDDLDEPTFRPPAALHAGQIELLAENPAGAEAEFRASYEHFKGLQEKAHLSTEAAFLALALLARGGAADEAEALSVESEEAAASDDLASQILWRIVRARALVPRGDLERALVLARDAERLAGRTDFLNLRGESRTALAEVCRAAGQTGEARRALESALRLYGRKRNLVASEWTRAALATFEPR